MAFTRLTTDVKNIQKLADRPQLSAGQLKAAFDTAVTDIKAYLAEVLAPELEANTAAGSVGATYVGDGDPNPEAQRNVQAKLNFLYSELKSAQSGQILDRSLEAVKLATGTLTENELADGAVTTAKIADGAVTPNKLGGALLDLLPVGFGMTWWSDTLPSNKWKTEGGTLSPGTHDEAIAFFGGRKLPQVRGKVVVCKDKNDAAFNELCRTGGEAAHKLLPSELASHTHSVAMDRVSNVSGYNGDGTSSSSRFQGRVVVSDDTGGSSTGANGGNLAHNNLQPYIVANYIFKVM